MYKIEQIKPNQNIKLYKFCKFLSLIFVFKRYLLLESLFTNISINNKNMRQIIVAE